MKIENAQQIKQHYEQLATCINTLSNLFEKKELTLAALGFMMCEAYEDRGQEYVPEDVMEKTLSAFEKFIFILIPCNLFFRGYAALCEKDGELAFWGGKKQPTTYFSDIIQTPAQSPE